MNDGPDDEVGKENMEFVLGDVKSVTYLDPLSIIYTFNSAFEPALQRKVSDCV